MGRDARRGTEGGLIRAEPELRRRLDCGRPPYTCHRTGERRRPRSPTGGPATNEIHRLLAAAVVAAVAGGAAWSIGLLLSGHPRGPAVDRAQAVVLSILIVAAAIGLPLLARGARPSDGLHLVYAVVAIGLIPLARSMLGRAGDTGARIQVAATFVLLAALVYRLFMTG